MKNKLGFTLIELLVVVLIIGILAAIALPKYQLVMDKAKYSQAITLLNVLDAAQNRYKLINGTFTTDLTKLDIELPSSGKIKNSSNDFYEDKWGYCILHDTGYIMCSVNIGRCSVGHFKWTGYNYSQRSCWVYPATDTRGNRLCQAVTAKKQGHLNGSYMVYYF